MPRCEGCGAWNWYPLDECRECGGPLTWTPVSGRGRLFSWTVVRHAFLPHFAEEVPYVTGLVSLEEAPSVRIVTRIVDADPARLRVDEPVEVTFRELSYPGVDGRVPAPFFTPVARS